MAPHDLNEEEEAEIKTYTIELDGSPFLAFRARDDDEAATFPELIYSPMSIFKKPSGKLTVREATITERAAWTRQSVEDEEDNDDDEDDHDPNRLIAGLWDDEKQPAAGSR